MKGPRNTLLAALCLFVALGCGEETGTGAPTARPPRAALPDAVPRQGPSPEDTSPQETSPEESAPEGAPSEGARVTEVLDTVAPARLPPDTDATKAARAALVARHVEGEGIVDDAVLAAMRAVPRHQFVPEDVRDLAYLDRPLAIGWDQTISQPYVVASMTEEAAIGPQSRVLEIGTGSGYQAAVLAEITPHVTSIEIKEPLARRAAATLKGAGYARVRVIHGDGYYGWPEAAPYDAIVVTAAAPQIPPPLVAQLAPGGRMVIPVGSVFATQDLVLVTKDAEGKVRTRSLYPVRFVPLTGSLGRDGGADRRPARD